MIRACLDQVPDIGRRSYPELRAMFYGASPIDRETLPTDHARGLADRPELLRSVGRAIPGTELQIVDAVDRPVATGVPGQILARGPQREGRSRRIDG